MPELPEVETIRMGLENKIIGLIIKNLQVLNPKSVQFNPKEVEGKKVLAVWRRAKMLGVDLGGEHNNTNLSLRGARATKQSNTGDRHASLAMTMLFHLKMTGQLIYIARNKKQETRLIGGHPTEDMKGQMPGKSTRAIFEFSDGSKLYFNDQRKFGWIKLIKSQESRVKSQEMENLLGKLGPEPFDKSFTWEILKKNLLRHKSQPIKVAIMDQSVVSGIGNIYSSEILFLAKIDPRRKVATLSDEDFQALYKAIIQALETGIKHGGSTRAHFVNIEGERGYFLDYANVYGKEGYKCNGCSGKVQKTQQTGRGTYWCPNCQK